MTGSAPGPRRRIGVLDDRFHQLYGAQRNAVLLARLLAEAGHDVVFYTTAEGRLADGVRAEAGHSGLDLRIVEAPLELRRFERAAVSNGVGGLIRTLAALVSYNRTLERALADDDREILIAAAVRPALDALWWRARGLRSSRRLVLFAQNNTPFGPFAAAAALASDRIGLIGPDCIRTFPTWTHRRIRERLRPLASGRDLTRFRAASPAEDEDAGESEDETAPLELLTVANIEPRKGIDRVIDAIADADLAEAVRLRVVGAPTGPRGEAHLDELRALATRRGVDVDFAGWSDDVVPWLHAADLFVLASSEEGLPGVLIEAMAAGVACVTTEAGNAGDLVRRCEGGLVVPVGDAAALADALRAMVDDPAERRAAGERGAERVGRHYDERAFAERAEAILSELSVS